MGRTVVRAGACVSPAVKGDLWHGPLGCGADVSPDRACAWDAHGVPEAGSVRKVLETSQETGGRRGIL